MWHVERTAHDPGSDVPDQVVTIISDQSWYLPHGRQSIPFADRTQTTTTISSQLNGDLELSLEN